MEYVGSLVTFVFQVQFVTSRESGLIARTVWFLLRYPPQKSKIIAMLLRMCLFFILLLDQALFFFFCTSTQPALSDIQGDAFLILLNFSSFPLFIAPIYHTDVASEYYIATITNVVIFYSLYLIVY
jgi:hypothetical protein